MKVRTVPMERPELSDCLELLANEGVGYDKNVRLLRRFKRRRPHMRIKSTTTGWLYCLFLDSDALYLYQDRGDGWRMLWRIDASALLVQEFEYDYGEGGG